MMKVHIVQNCPRTIYAPFVIESDDGRGILFYLLQGMR